MELPKRGRLGHEVPPWVDDGAFLFVSVNCVPRGMNQLCVAGTGEAVLAAAAHHHETRLWYCQLLLLMPDHLHGIIAFPREPGMAKTISNWKRFLAGHQDIQWQRDFFDHRLRDHHELQEKSSYILLNPVRAHLCARPEDWKWIYRPNDRPPPKI